MKTDTYYSPFSEKRILRILAEQIDQTPSIFQCVVSLNAARYIGTSSVCGTFAGNMFELRNRKDPFFSLRAHGSLKVGNSGTLIEIQWVKPKIPDLFGVLFLGRYSIDKDTILNFLREQMHINP
ncbi:hypothetical protein [Desulfosarcina variabilis]|uniref:hypothetical protein n=1 Tax=Desulfosarcina variabilis TaxID=2300 RepID=UPI003AFB5235